MAGRKSAFQEVGLPAANRTTADGSPKRPRPQSVRFRSKDEVHVVERHEDDEVIKELDLSNNGADKLPPTQIASPAPSGRRSVMYRFAATLLLLGGLVSLLQSTGFVAHPAALPIPAVSGGAVPAPAGSTRHVQVERRDSSATNWCFKWAQQSAIVNGTLYLYGGQLSTEAGQTQNTWTKDFISLDLTKTWQTGSPTLKGLPQPAKVPAVALGYLWASHESLFLYGGEFSWQPPVSPVPFATWEYNIPSNQWIEHSDPVTSSGLSAPENDVAVQRAAEGAGTTVPSLGRGFYFGGHLDGYTTPGWSQSIPRVYLQSLLEFTFPGYTNPEVKSLQGGQVAGSAGVYRNITQGGIQNAGFTARADGLLIFVPGFGKEGILIALGGGTNETYTQMNVINVYDIETSTWYIQATSGAYPEVRVNPCAVIAAAPDGSSYNIYMFGGQNLIPYYHQTQYHDMWILTLPSFQWIKVPQDKQSVPYGRSGATCNIWDAQMVMVGGYLGNSTENQLSCEYPAVYVFDLSTCEWQTEFKALGANADNLGPTNDLNQQPNQRLDGSNPGGLEGSYGYTVPEIVIEKIGGNGYGGATITKPVETATAGPLKTGSPVTYTLTKPGGQRITETAVPNGYSGSKGGGTNVAAIVVGVVCGVLFIIICYLLFCLFVYRKQLALYKRHVEMSQREARGEKPPAIAGLWATESRQDSSDRGKHLSPTETGSQAGSNNNRSHGGSGPQASSAPRSGDQSGRRSSNGSSTEDLLAGNEPTFVGVMLNPRRSLRVINRD